MNTMQSPATFRSPVQLPAHSYIAPAGSADDSLVAINPAWRKLLTQAELVAPHIQVAVLEGESGCGKQTLARFLHSRSHLAETPFQQHDARQWLVQEADPVTTVGFYYLDRVDMLAGPGQNLLLGVLKGLQDRPAGRAVVLTSTQTSLRQMTSQGLMLPDLAFRLTAVRFAVPPLRQRKEEIGPLAQSLLAQLCNRYQQRPVALGPGALARLIQHDWPGNIRELSSVLEAALIDAANGVIRAEDLPIAANEQIPAQPQAMPRPENLDLDTVIRRHVEYVLDLNRGNKLRAARQLGISRSTLYRILGNQSLVA